MFNIFGLLFCCYLIMVIVLSPVAALIIKVSILSYNEVDVTPALVGSDGFWADQNMVAYAIIFIFCAVVLFIIGTMLWTGFFWILGKVCIGLLRFFCCTLPFGRCHKNEEARVELLSVY